MKLSLRFLANFISHTLFLHIVQVFQFVPVALLEVAEDVEWRLEVKVITYYNKHLLLYLNECFWKFALYLLEQNVVTLGLLLLLNSRWCWNGSLIWCRTLHHISLTSILFVDWFIIQIHVVFWTNFHIMDDSWNTEACQNQHFKIVFSIFTLVVFLANMKNRHGCIGNTQSIFVLFRCHF